MAFFTVNGIPYPLVRVTRETMDEQMHNEQTKDIVGFPYMFDDDRRIWPKPQDGIKVEFEDDAP